MTCKSLLQLCSCSFGLKQPPIQYARRAGNTDSSPTSPDAGVAPARMVELSLKTVAYGAGGLAVAGLSLLVAFQEKMVYVPVIPGIPRSYSATPARYGLDYEDVWLRSSDGVRLHSWFIRHSPRRSGPTILFFQENAGNIAHRLELIQIMLQRLQCNVFMLSYRGYGESDGYPSQHGIIKDAQAALDHLSQRKDIDTTKIVVFGRSLGGAVGSVIARNNPEKVSVLILENTFTSILDMAGVMLPFLSWFIGGSASKGPKLLNGFVRSPWSTIEIIGQIKQPILFLSGLQDELVPPSHMRMLYDKAVEHNKNCLFVEFPTGTHMDTWYTGGDRYWRTIQLFFQRDAPEILGSASNGEVEGNHKAHSGNSATHSLCDVQKMPKFFFVMDVSRVFRQMLPFPLTFESPEKWGCASPGDEDIHVEKQNCCRTRD